MANGRFHADNGIRSNVSTCKTQRRKREREKEKKKYFYKLHVVVYAVS